MLYAVVVSAEACGFGLAPRAVGGGESQEDDGVKVGGSRVLKRELLMSKQRSGMTFRVPLRGSCYSSASPSIYQWTYTDHRPQYQFCSDIPVDEVYGMLPMKINCPSRVKYFVQKRMDDGVYLLCDSIFR
ncbi:hypothetical protein Tco_0451421 [Tanacetum coccineum]